MPLFEKILNSKFIDQYGPALVPSFDFVNTQASAELDLPVPPDLVNTSVHKVISQEGHLLAGESDDRMQLALITKKTWFSWENVTGIVIAPTPQGSHLSVYMANMPGRPTALLDGLKNKRAAKRLAEQIRAAS